MEVTAKERVYPRACGGTSQQRTVGNPGTGLSPRLRGNRPQILAVGIHPRFIPAPAGEPPSDSPSGCESEVYPRACGGTAALPSRRMFPIGLSPRLRGNLYVPLGTVRQVRFIPAPAGEPTSWRACWVLSRVYPRACGGTPNVGGQTRPYSGLSPRLRGNGCYELQAKRVNGFIPAPAGEPQGHYTTSVSKSVYPRACGGTVR